LSTWRDGWLDEVLTGFSQLFFWQSRVGNSKTGNNG
jgi:hypothetical protein